VSWTIQVSNPDKTIKFFLSKMPRPVLGAQPPLQRVPVVSCAAMKRMGRGADKSHQSNPEIKNKWSFQPLNALMLYTGKTLPSTLGRRTEKVWTAFVYCGFHELRGIS